VLKEVTQIEINALRTASSGGIVFDERVDSFELNVKCAAVPVVGVFEMTRSGEIKARRDYFDIEADLRAFLASERASFITGSVYEVDRASTEIYLAAAVGRTNTKDL
jgi:hypothetical protein